MRTLFLSFALLIFAPVAMAQSPVLEITGNWAYSTTGTNSTALDGTVYNGGSIWPNFPSFPVVFHDTNGDGNVYVKFYFAKTGGRFKADETLSGLLTLGANADGYTWQQSFSRAIVQVLKDADTQFHADARAPDIGESAQGTTQATVRLELRDPGNNVVDFVDLTFIISIDVVLSASGSPSVAWASTPTVHLYENGVLPLEGRPDVVPQGTEFNTTLSGTVENQSGEEQGIQVWTLDANGEPVLQSEMVVSPGASANIDLGANVQEGGDAFIIVTGEIEGGTGSNVIPFGENHTGDYVFPPQEYSDHQIFIENTSDQEFEISIGNEGGMQEHVTVPPGISEKKTTYQGEVDVFGGEAVEVIPGNGSDKVIVVVVPEGNGTAETVSQATIPDGSGGTSTSTVVEFPSGNQVMVGNDDSAAESPSTPGTGVSGTAGTAVTSGQGLDKAADAINAIRAEANAVSSRFEDMSESTLSDGIDTVGLVETLEGTRTDLASLTEDVGEDSDEFLVLKPEFSPIPTGDVSSYTFNVLGEGYTIDFDYPGISFFRNLMLVFCSLAWFIFLLKMSKT